MNKNKFLYVAALFGMMVLVSCSSHDSAKNVTVTSEQGGAESQAASDIVSKPLTLLQSNDGWSYGAAGAKGFVFCFPDVQPLFPMQMSKGKKLSQKTYRWRIL